MQVLKLFCVAIFVLGSVLTISAQQTQLQQVNNPNLEQKRLNYTNPTNTTPAPSSTKPNPIDMANKYEETAIRRWKEENPTVLIISRNDYNSLSVSKKQEIDNKGAVLYDEKIKWSDIQEYEDNL